jgi:lipoate-protein ligase A
MALDEALLDLVAGGEKAAYLRTYGWTIPTLSIGYFQQLSQVSAEGRWDEVPIVRRLTGGGAIWHHHELTYALVVPGGCPLARPSTKLYQIVHQAIAATITSLGVCAERRGDTVSSPRAERKRPLLCFTDPNPDDIVAKGAKVVGSAQRRRAGAVLQHGSLLLVRSVRVPELPGVCDVADAPSDTEYWSSRLLARIPDALGMRPILGDLNDEVLRRALELERAVYRNQSWTALL